MKRLVGLNYIRGISSLLILFYHYTTRYQDIFHNAGAEISHKGLWWGSWAVSTFFILSGFLTVYNLKQDVTAHSFLKKRAVRLYPAYWVCLIITTVVVNLFMERYKVSALTFVFNISMLQGFIGIKNVDGAYWTLTYEILFYIIVALTIIAGNFISLKNIYEKVAFVWIGFTVVYEVVLSKVGISSFALSLLTNYAHLFVIGISIFYIFHSRKNYLSFVNLIFAVFVHFVKYDVVYTVFVIAVIVLVFLLVKKEISFKYDNVLNLLSEISFPLYLIHQLMGYTIIYYFDTLWGFKTCGIVVAFVISLIVAYLIHGFVEKPMVSLSKNDRRKDIC